MNRETETFKKLLDLQKRGLPWPKVALANQTMAAPTMPTIAPQQTALAPAPTISGQQVPTGVSQERLFRSMDSSLKEIVRNTGDEVEY